MVPKSYISHLECTGCSTAYSADQIHSTCPACHKVLYARYDLDRVRTVLSPDELKGRRSDLWRFFELLPLRNADKVITLGEGITPMLRANRLEQALNVKSLHLKDEGVNPTGSFKARGMAVAVSKAGELGIERLVVPSAGNAAGAMAAYCARSGMEAHVYMPQDTPIANKKEADVMAAYLNLVDGLITDAGKVARAHANERGLFDLSTMREPYRVEGKKTMGYEIAMDLDWKLPEVIVYPTGGGTGIVGIWKAFEEMETLGWIGSDRPRMIAIQAEGCAPIVRAFENGAESAEPWEGAETVASGIRVPAAIGDYLILNVVRESGGTAITVSDPEIIDSIHQIARLEGIWPAPEGAATLAGYNKLVKAGKIDPSESTVLLNTGSGLKYQDLV